MKQCAESEKLQICKVKIHDQFILLVYRAPDASDKENEELFKYVNNMNDSDMIIGDFNFREINWNLMTSSTKFRKFLDILLATNTHQIVDVPTIKSGRTLDLILTKDPDEIKHLDIQPNNLQSGGSDHYIITFDLNILPEPKKIEKN